MPDLFQGGWSNIGTLCREKPWLGILQARIVPELPEEVQRVDISVHKVLPSAVVVALDVHLSIHPQPKNSGAFTIARSCEQPASIAGDRGGSTVGAVRNLLPNGRCKMQLSNGKRNSIRGSKALSRHT